MENNVELYAHTLYGGKKINFSPISVYLCNSVVGTFLSLEDWITYSWKAFFELFKRFQRSNFFPTFLIFQSLQKIGGWPKNGLLESCDSKGFINLNHNFQSIFSYKISPIIGNYTYVHNSFHPYSRKLSNEQAKIFMSGDWYVVQRKYSAKIQSRIKFSEVDDGLPLHMSLLKYDNDEGRLFYHLPFTKVKIFL